MFAWLTSNVPAVSFRVPRSRKTFTRLEVLSSLSTNAAAPLLPASCLEQGGSGLEFSAKVWPCQMASNYFWGQHLPFSSCELDLTYATKKKSSNCGRFWMSSKVAAIPIFAKLSNWLLSRTSTGLPMTDLLRETIGAKVFFWLRSF